MNEDLHHADAVVVCPDCGKRMSKRKFSLYHNGKSTVYQWMCRGFPRCDKRLYVTADGTPLAKMPVGNNCGGKWNPKGKH